MRIIGIDPGIAIVGYAVLDIFPDGEVEIITTGSIQTDKNSEKPNRLLEISEDLTTLIKEFKPQTASIEKLFYCKNLKTVMPVSEARGVILMTLAKFGVEIFEYTPLEVKMTITGHGRASKDEVKEMTCNFLQMECLPKLDDTVDAIAIGLTHTRIGMLQTCTV